MKTRRSFAVAIGVFLLATTGTNQGFAYPRPSVAAVVVGIPLPPPLVIPAPPALVIVPGTNVYVAPDVEGDILFFQGFWWRLYEGHWYRSASYGGPWRYMARERVPRGLFGFSPGFHSFYRHNHRLHHNEVMGNWQRWDREGHWERHHQR